MWTSIGGFLKIVNVTAPFDGTEVQIFKVIRKRSIWLRGPG